MTREETQIGVVVTLNSGGPEMTISSIYEDKGQDTRVWCVWFDGKKKCEELFSIQTLQIKKAQASFGISFI